jgi:hypothetical protein
MSLSGKKILIAISGGIAAYKVHFLIRDFVKKGAEVQVIMTPDAENFVTKLSISTLSKKPVYTDFYSDNGTWNSHVEMALWADVMIVAPCTANTLSKMVHGMCDNLVPCFYCSCNGFGYVYSSFNKEKFRLGRKFWAYHYSCRKWGIGKWIDWAGKNDRTGNNSEKS